MALSGQWKRVVVAQDCRLRTVSSLALHRSAESRRSEGREDTSSESSVHRMYPLKRGFFSSFVRPPPTMASSSSTNTSLRRLFLCPLSDMATTRAA